MFKSNTSISFGIIGLGQFGFALAKTLAESGEEVLILDNHESKVRQVRVYTEHAFVIENLEKETLEETGIQNCSTVIVCIGEKIDTSILTTLNILNLGVPRVISKAVSFDQGRVLEKIGAEVIYPERDMAIRLASSLMSSRIMDYMSLNSDIDIAELVLTNKLNGKTVMEANLRKQFGLNIIAIDQHGKTVTEIDPHCVLHEDNMIVVVGKRDNIQRLEHFLSGTN